LGKKDIHAVVDAYNACVERRTIKQDDLLARREALSAKINAWVTLEEKVKEKEFDQKSTALEMIAEIRKKIQRQESIPNFLIEGLKQSLRDTGLSAELEVALEQLN